MGVIGVSLGVVGLLGVVIPVVLYESGSGWVLLIFGAYGMFFLFAGIVVGSLELLAGRLHGVVLILWLTMLVVFGASSLMYFGFPPW